MGKVLLMFKFIKSPGLSFIVIFAFAYIGIFLFWTFLQILNNIVGKKLHSFSILEVTKDIVGLEKKQLKYEYQQNKILIKDFLEDNSKQD